MTRILWALLFTIVVAGPSWAGAADDLRAGLDAAKAGRYDAAVASLTKALDGGTLSAEDQVAARRARGDAYVSKSLMADAFDRRDEARRLRDDATADLAQAIALKPNDPDLLSERANAFYMNGQYDPAVADFDAALKLRTSAILLLQRATAYRAKGEYDRALADYDQAVKAPDLKEAGIEPWDIDSERGYAEFLAGRFDGAASDFQKSLALGLPAHEGDVLWAPYQLAWLHVARARAGQDDKTELGELAKKINLDQWPGTLVAYFLGQRSLADIGTAGSHAAMGGKSRDCNLAFFVGQDSLAKGDAAAAERNLRHARDVCAVHTINALAADVALKRMTK